jgi:hypothetical protein
MIDLFNPLGERYCRSFRALACAKRQQIRRVQFGHGRILRFLDHEDPSLRLDHNPAPARLSCLRANRARKKHLYLASLRLKKPMHSTQRPTIGPEFAVTRERIRQIEAKTLRKLRQPSLSGKLKLFLDDVHE